MYHAVADAVTGLRALLLLSFLLAAPAWSAGLLDPSFGSAGSGKLINSFGDSQAWGSGTAIQPDGKILVLGNRATTKPLLLRYTSAGTPDSAFGINGAVTVDYGGLVDRVDQITLQMDGKIVILGSTYLSAPGEYVVSRHLQDGSLDPSFGINGLARFQPRVFWPVRIAVQPNGRVLLAGSLLGPNDTGMMAAALLTSDGHIDTAFGSNGFASASFKATDLELARGLGVQSDGKILLAGSAQTTSGDFLVARFTSTGLLDQTFGTGGQVRTVVAGGPSILMHAKLQPDGKFLSVGWAANQMAVVRYLPDGKLDAGFGNGGVALDPAGVQANAVALQSDGKIILIGSGDDLKIVRLTSAGVLDQEFGRRTTDFAGSSDEASGIALQADDKIVVVTRSFNGSNSTVLGLARYLPYSVADLAATVATSSKNVVVGGIVQFSVRLANGGPETAPSVVLSAPVPSNAQFSGASSTAGPCALNASVVVCNLSALSPSANASVQISLTATTSGTLTQAATVEGPTTVDTNLVNNTATSSLSIVGPPAGRRPPR